MCSQGNSRDARARGPNPSNDVRADIESAKGSFVEDSKVGLGGPAKLYSKGVRVQGHAKGQLTPDKKDGDFE